VGLQRLERDELSGRVIVVRLNTLERPATLDLHGPMLRPIRSVRRDHVREIGVHLHDLVPRARVTEKRVRIIARRQHVLVAMHALPRLDVVLEEVHVIHARPVALDVVVHVILGLTLHARLTVLNDHTLLAIRAVRALAGVGQGERGLNGVRGLSHGASFQKFLK